MTAKPIYCPNCDRKVSAADVNIAEMAAVCTVCDHIFSIRSLIGNAAADEPEPSRPSGITVQSDTSGELLITRTWFHNMFIFMLFFCIAWDGFLIFWYSMALTDLPGNNGFDVIALLFPICHVTVGIGLTYYTIAGFFNRSEIFVDRDGLHIRHRPIPWRGNRDLRRDEICEIELDSSHSQNVEHGMRQMVVSAHHADGRQVILLNHIPVRHAEFIAWHLADSLEVPLIRMRGSEQTV